MSIGIIKLCKNDTRCATNCLKILTRVHNKLRKACMYILCDNIRTYICMKYQQELKHILNIIKFNSSKVNTYAYRKVHHDGLFTFCKYTVLMICMYVRMCSSYVCMYVILEMLLQNFLQGLDETVNICITLKLLLFCDFSDTSYPCTN